MPKWDKSFQALEIYKQLLQSHEILKDYSFFSRSIDSTFDLDIT